MKLENDTTYKWPYGYVLRLSYSVCKPMPKWLYTTTTKATGEYTLVQSKVYIFVRERKREREKQTSAYLNTHKISTIVLCIVIYIGILHDRATFINHFFFFFFLSKLSISFRLFNKQIILNLT